MKLEDVKKRKRFAACASDEDVLKEIDALESEAAKVPLTMAMRRWPSVASRATASAAAASPSTETQGWSGWAL